MRVCVCGSGSGGGDGGGGGTTAVSSSGARHSPSACSRKNCLGARAGNLGRFVLRGKAQPVGVHTKQLSRQGRGQDNLGRLRRRRLLECSPPD